MRIGVLGAGSFAASFIPLFQAHPAVDEVVLAEVLPERRAEQAARFGITRTVGSLDELCRTDVDAIAILTQRWLHGPQAVTALRAGKHVYSAVPAAITLDELDTLVEAVRTSGGVYMLGETSTYYPVALWCRERFARGDFGRFVYGEGEYLHDMSTGFYEAYQHSGGADWKRTASFPPMLYPSHSVSMVLSVTGARMTHVSCLGWRDDHADGVFRREVSQWGNDLANQTALFRTSDGGMCRINEFRRVGYRASPEVRLSLFGTAGNFEEQTEARVWNTFDATEDLTERLRCRDRDLTPAERARYPGATGPMRYTDLSDEHPAHRLPREFLGAPNGHEGSHQFLVLDFIEAILEGRHPLNHVWAAARYCAPGIVAHESSQRDGELLPIPDFGDAPGAGPGHSAAGG